MRAACVGAEVSIPGPKPLYICAVGVIQKAVAANKNNTFDFRNVASMSKFYYQYKSEKDKRHLSSRSSPCFDV